MLRIDNLVYKSQSFVKYNENVKRRLLTKCLILKAYVQRAYEAENKIDMGRCVEQMSGADTELYAHFHLVVT